MGGGARAPGVGRAETEALVMGEHLPRFTRFGHVVLPLPWVGGSRVYRIGR